MHAGDGGERESERPTSRSASLLARLGSPGAPRLVVAFGVLLAVPTLAGGFFSDDWYMLAALRHAWPGAPPWWDLYRFVPGVEGVRAEIASGALPWWTAPRLHVHLVRPVTSALLALDERLFGDAAPLWHLHTLLWWSALLLIVAALLRRVLRGATGTLALLIFTIVPGHASDYGWLSSRHMLVAAVPAVAALLAHVRAREEGWSTGRWLGPVALALGLACSEAALGVAALWVAYEALGPEVLGSRRQRLASAAPPVLMAMAYLVAYRLAGGGMGDNDIYVTPLPDPSRFALAVAERLPMLLGDSLLGVPAELAMGAGSWPLVAVGVAAVALTGLLWRASSALVPREERAALRWLVPGAVLAVAGTCGGIPSGRALLIANLGFSVLLAVLIRRGWDRGAASLTWRLAAGLLAFIHLAFAPVGSLATVAAAARMARQSTAVARALPADTRPATRVFILAASDPMVNVYAPANLRAEGGGGLTCIARLASAKADYRVTRLDATTLAIEPVGRPLLRTTFETLYRARALRMQAGDEVTQCGARVRVAAVEDGSPTRLEVRFDLPLDDPGLATVAWDGDRLARVRLAIGETRLLPWRPGPMLNE